MSLVLTAAPVRSVRASQRTTTLLLRPTFALVFAVQLAFALGPASARNHARAYCQLTTEKPKPGELCSSTGIKASWKRACLCFSLTDPGPSLPPLEDMLKVADLSFGAWADVDCQGNPIGFEVARTEQLSQCRVPEYN